MTVSKSPKLSAKFVKLWAASTTSALGSGLITIATPLFVASRTSNPLMISLATIAVWIPWLLFTLPGGVLVDRVDRRRLMTVLDCSRGVVMSVLGIMILVGDVKLWVLFTALFLVQTGEVLFRSASSAMIPALAPHQLLDRANGWLLGGTVTTQQMIAGPLGGFLFVVAASIPFLASAGTYAISAVLTGLIPGVFRVAGHQKSTGGAREVGAPPVHRGPDAVRADIADSFRFLKGQRLLRTMSVAIGVLNVTFYGALAVLVLLAKQRLHLGSVGYGLLFTAMAVGGVLGSALGDRLVKRVTATWTIRVGLVVEALTHLTLATSRNPYLVGFALFALGIHSALWTLVGNSLRQRLTPPEMMGRSASLNMFIVFGGNAIGAIAGGTLAKQFGITAPYWVAFVVAAVVAVSTWHVFNRAEVMKAYQTPPYVLANDDPSSVTAVGLQPDLRGNCKTDAT